MSRYLAAFYHLLISIAIFAVLAYLIVFVWYPDFFYSIDGGWEGMRIIIAVDLVLGPCLTLIVFKTGKPGLKFDLTAIGLFQAICLAAGTYLVYTERPLFFVYYEGHFYSASADTYARFETTAPDPFDHSDSTPAFVVAMLPADPIEEADFRAQLYLDRLPVWTFEKTYESMDQHLDKILTKAYPMEKLRSRDEDGKLEPWLTKHGGVAEDFAFYPVHSRYVRPFVAIDRRTNEFVGVLDVPAPFAYYD